MAKTDLISANSTRNPEKFLQENEPIYTNGELRDAIERFEQASASRPVYSTVIALFKACLKFRYAATADNMFARMRNESETDDGLMKIFAKIQLAFDEAESNIKSLKGEDKKILQQALRYAQKSICKQMSELPAEDRLTGLWKKSELKRLCE